MLIYLVGGTEADLSALNENAIEYIIAVPGVLFAFSTLKSESILLIEGSSKAKLQKWPDFWRLKTAVYIGLVYSFIFLAIGIGGWFMINKQDTYLEVILVCTSIAGTFIVAMSQYMASLTIRIMLSETE